MIVHSAKSVGNTKAFVKEVEAAFDGSNLRERLSYLARNLDAPVFESRFTLADQVIAHALVAGEFGFSVVDGSSRGAGLSSLKAITAERYDLRFKRSSQAAVAGQSGKPRAQFVSVKRAGDRVEINPVADWSEAQLVAYILDHEVPVNPADMPGFDNRAAA